jgi:small subunit ribosomal protein S11e
VRLRAPTLTFVCVLVSLRIRGRILRGVVKSTKMKRTIIVRRDYLHYVKKYNRYEKRHTNVPAHVSPCFAVHEGDEVTIGQCRYVGVFDGCVMRSE